MNRGLDANQRNWTGTTFLHVCAEKFDRSSAGLFLESGADINARDVEFQETPLATAIRTDPWREDESVRPRIEEDRMRMVRWLLKHGATVSLPDDKPWSRHFALPVVAA